MRGEERAENDEPSMGETIILQCIVSGALLVLVLLISLLNVAPTAFLRDGLRESLSGAETAHELFYEVREFLEQTPVEEEIISDEIFSESSLPTATASPVTLVAVATQSDPLWATPVVGRVSSPTGIRNNPVTGRREFHDGIDIAIPIDTPILAPKDGEIIASGFCNGYGRFMRLSHDNGYITFYAHLNRAIGSVGDIVSQGSKIAYSGNTGQSTGAHLHFGIFKDGQFVDPLTRINP
jgi:murein DD-endopeptidase MepM/ murein hydrolase activator NlpD